MAGYTLDVPEELYEALQKMAPYATYTYTDEDGDWDLLSPAGHSALTEDRVLNADLLNLYFEVLPQIATLSPSSTREHSIRSRRAHTLRH